MQGGLPRATSPLQYDTYALLSSVPAQYVFQAVKHRYRKGLCCIRELQPFCWAKYTFHSVSLPRGDGPKPREKTVCDAFLLWEILDNYSEAYSVSWSPNTVLFPAAIMVLLKMGQPWKYPKLHIFHHVGCNHSKLKRAKESIQSTSAANIPRRHRPCTGKLNNKTWSWSSAELPRPRRGSW